MCVAVKSLYSRPILVSVADVNKVTMVQMLVMRAILRCPKMLIFKSVHVCLSFTDSKCHHFVIFHLRCLSVSKN